MDARSFQRRTGVSRDPQACIRGAEMVDIAEKETIANVMKDGDLLKALEATVAAPSAN